MRLLWRNGLGVDILPSSVTMSNSSDVRSILADVLYLPFRDSVFDGVPAIQPLEYIFMKMNTLLLRSISVEDGVGSD